MPPQPRDYFYSWLQRQLYDRQPDFVPVATNFFLYAFAMAGDLEQMHKICLRSQE